MINRIIEWSLRNRFLVVCGAVLLAGFGVRALYQTPVDAIPDLSENQVIVFADWPGRGPQEVEDMSQSTSPSRYKVYGTALVCRTWKVSRATVYRHWTAACADPDVAQPSLRRGPVGACGFLRCRPGVPI